MVERHATLEKKSWVHMDCCEEARHKTEKGRGLACCYLVSAVSRNRQQDQTSGGLEVEAGTKLHGQAVGASQQQ